MTPSETKREPETFPADAVSRRALLKGAAAAGLGVAALGLGQTAQAADGPQQPEADTGHDYPMTLPHAKTGEDFFMGVIGPATLSVAASQIAVYKAAAAAAKQFANFELREAIAVTAIIKSLNIPAPPMSAEGKALLNKLETTPKGADFDKTYIAAELANHEFLRDLAETYLKNATGHAGAKETHGRHLATLALTAFKEHVVLTKNIAHALEA